MASLHLPECRLDWKFECLNITVIPGAPHSAAREGDPGETVRAISPIKIRHRPLYAGDPITLFGKQNGLPGQAGQ
jgi:hypothetical protein